MNIARTLTNLALFLSIAATSSADDVSATSESLRLMTSDGVVLHCFYYPGSEGKETVPVILLHGWSGPRGSGSSRDFDELALELQSAGRAVIAPDLRGHGLSTVRKTPTGAKITILPHQLGPAGLTAMVISDVEAVKRFLIEQHNEGSLNIELLCVVGTEMGAAIAARWVAQDWAWPVIREIKQGQDAQALVLVSPPASFRNLSTTQAMNFAPMKTLPTMIVYGGKDERATRDAKRIHKQLQPHHRPSTDKAKQTLVLIEQPTSLRGAALLDPGLDTVQQIQEFINHHIVARRGRRPWRPRVTLNDDS